MRICSPALKVPHPGNTVEKVDGATQCKDKQADADNPHQGLTAILLHLLFIIFIIILTANGQSNNLLLSLDRAEVPSKIGRERVSC